MPTRAAGTFVLQVCPLLVASLAFAQSRHAADLIITNAKVWTVDKVRPTADAVAVIGERIVAVGSSTEIEMWPRDADAPCPALTTQMFTLSAAECNWMLCNSMTLRAKKSSLAELASGPKEHQEANG